MLGFSTKLDPIDYWMQMDALRFVWNLPRYGHFLKTCSGKHHHSRLYFQSCLYQPELHPSLHPTPVFSRQYAWPSEFIKLDQICHLMLPDASNFMHFSKSHKHSNLSKILHISIVSPIPSTYQVHFAHQVHFAAPIFSCIEHENYSCPTFHHYPKCKLDEWVVRVINLLHSLGKLRPDHCEAFTICSFPPD